MQSFIGFPDFLSGSRPRTGVCKYRTTDSMQRQQTATFSIKSYYEMLPVTLIDKISSVSQLMQLLLATEQRLGPYNLPQYEIGNRVWKGSVSVHISARKLIPERKQVYTLYILKYYNLWRSRQTVLCEFLTKKTNLLSFYPSVIGLSFKESRVELKPG